MSQAAHPLELPNDPSEYLRNLGGSYEKACSWVAACWQLRNCDRVGKWVRVDGRLIVRNYGEIVVGDRVRWYARYADSLITTFPGGRLDIGDRTVFNYGLDLAATGLVRIGADVMIGTHVSIMDNDFHDPIDHDRMPAPKPVHIGDRAWIGNRSIVLPGVTIGERAVVGAGSVVMTDIPASTLALGNPARVIKKL